MIIIKMKGQRTSLVLVLLSSILAIKSNGLADASGIEKSCHYLFAYLLRKTCTQCFYNIIHYFVQGLFQQEGEVCGPCYNLETFDCGECAEGLVCVEDERAHFVPDLPSRCRFKIEAVKYNDPDEGRKYYGGNNH